MADQGVTGGLMEIPMGIEWRIDNFHLFSRNFNDFYKSSVFHFMDSRWYMTIHPNGSSSKCLECMSVSLTRDDCGPPKTVNYTFELLVNYVMRSLSDTFKAGDSTKASETFVMRREVERSIKIGNSRSLKIRCYLENVSPKIIPIRPMKLAELDALSGDLESLLVDGVNCDVTINVQNKEFRAHRVILAARSEVFAAMFADGSSGSKSGVVDIADCDSGSFGDFLRYLYTGKLEEVTQSKVIHLYRTADKYAVLKLKSFCVQYMMKNVSAQSVCAVARLAEEHCEDELLASAQTVFNHNVAKVLSMNSWEDLLREDYLLAYKLLTQMASKMKIDA